MLHDVVIVGAGPAGMSASIYLQRIGFKPLVLEMDRPGGLLLNANLVENYPGFPDGVTGKELVKIFRNQMDRWGVEIRSTKVEKIVPTEDRFSLLTRDGEIQSRAVILATGTRPMDASIDGEETYAMKKLFYEVRDLPIENGQEYVVVGGGDAAFDYAMSLSSRAKRVDIVYRSSEPKCIKLLFDRVERTPNINLVPDTEPSSIGERNGQLHLLCKTHDGEKELYPDYILAACGRKPNSVEVEGLGKISDGIRGCETEIPGLYVAGDVRSGRHRQVGIAVGDGIKAAMSVADYLIRGEKR